MVQNTASLMHSNRLMCHEPPLAITKSDFAKTITIANGHAMQVPRHDAGGGRKTTV